MTEQVWVATYHSTNSPKSHEWSAVLYRSTRGDDGAVKQTRLPVYFVGQSEDEVKGKAEAFWEAECIRAFGSVDARRAALEKANAARAARKKARAA